MATGAAVQVDGTLCVISPHLDDGVLSCAHLLAAHPGATVVTVFAGVPAGPAGPWDLETTGVGDAVAANELRRAEDAAALALLGAEPRWLDLHEADYDDATIDVRVDRVRREAGRVLDELRPATVVAPLGFLHVDHRTVALASARMVAGHSARWYLYEDLPYAQSWSLPARLRRRVLRLPDYRREALRQLRGEAIVAGRVVEVGGEPEQKVQAVGCYTSQVPKLRSVFPRYDDRLAGPERYWPVRAA